MQFKDRLDGFDRDTTQHKTRGFRIWIPIFYLLFSLLLFTGVVESSASGLDESLYVTNGTVYDIILDETTLYIAGDFSRVGPRTGNGSALDPVSGAAIDGFPTVTGTIYSVISDGQDPNGWYIAGEFTHVDGILQFSVAHILPDNSLDLGFNPFLSSGITGPIYAMALKDDILYIGGAFENLLGLGIYGLAALDIEAFTIIAWAPNPTGGSVETGISTMVIAGSTLYVAGDFDQIGGQDRPGLAALPTYSEENWAGMADPAWDPSPGSASVDALVLSGGHLYVGGTFANIGGQVRSRIAAIEALDTGDGTGKADATWDPNATGDSVGALLLSGNHLYAGGKFTSIGGQMRNGIAAIDLIGAGDGTGRADATWHPDITSITISSMALDETSNRLFVGGDFSHVGGTARNHIAAIDALGGGDGTGDVDAVWDPNPNLPVRSLLLSSDAGILYIGGRFTSLGGLTRNRIAALDKATGVPTSWDPDADDRVRSLVLSGTTLYAGGLFANIGGQARNHIAALDTNVDANNATPWDPNADAGVMSMLLDGTTIYVGGGFTQIGDAARDRIAALDTTIDTNNATGWDPDADDVVHTILLDGTTLYVGGAFTWIGGSARNRIASLDTTVDTNNATAWDANVSFADGGASVINAMALYGTTLYAGGAFDTIGGSERNNIAALDTEVNVENATSWNPNLDSAVYAMSLSGPSLYVGGVFKWSGGDGINDEDDPGGIDRGVPRRGIAVLDIARDVLIARTWNLVLYSGTESTAVHSVFREGLVLYVGGDFDGILGATGGNLARYTLTPPVVAVDLASGTYPKEQFARMACEPAEGFDCDTVYYTLDGSDPTPFSNRVQFGGIYVESNSTFKFFGVDNAGAESPITTLSYLIQSEDAVCFIDTASKSKSIPRFIEAARRIGTGLVSQLGSARRQCPGPP